MKEKVGGFESKERKEGRKERGRKQKGKSHADSKRRRRRDSVATPTEKRLFNGVGGGRRGRPQARRRPLARREGRPRHEEAAAAAVVLSFTAAEAAEARGLSFISARPLLLPGANEE